MNKKYLTTIFFLIAIFFLLLAGASFAQETSRDRATEIIYPTLPLEVETPTTIKIDFLEYFKYIFYFVISVAGIIVFGLMVYGGVLYLTSEGNPAKINDARNRIFSGLLGLILVLSSYLILTTISPDLTTLVYEPEQTGWIVLYNQENCNEQGEKLYLKGDISNLEFEVSSFKFSVGPEDLEVIFYSERNFEGANTRQISPGIDCQNWRGTVGSVLFRWKLAGIYLCTGPLNEDSWCDPPSKELHIGQDVALLPRDFNDQVKGLRIKNREKIITVPDSDADCRSICKTYYKNITYSRIYREEPFWLCACTVSHYQAILHSASNFTGDCSRVRETTTNLEDEISVGYRSSSVTFFDSIAEWQFDLSDLTGGVWLCKKEFPTAADRNDSGVCLGPFQASSRSMDPDPESGEELWLGWENNIKSIIIEGNYMVVLFAERGYQGLCQRFFSSRGRIVGTEPIGRCYDPIFGWQSCVSSFSIIPLSE